MSTSLEMCTEGLYGLTYFNYREIGLINMDSSNTLISFFVGSLMGDLSFVAWRGEVTFLGDVLGLEDDPLVIFPFPLAGVDMTS